MLLPILFFNLTMAIIDVWLLAMLRRQRTISSLGRVCVLSAGAAIVLLVTGEVLLWGGRFLAFRMAACGLFGHGPVLLAGSAVLLRRQRRKTAIAAAVAAVALGAVAVDAFLIEPTWLEVSHVRLASDKLSQPVRIVLLADLQTDVLGPYERSVLGRVLREKPDLILLGGDYVQTDASRQADLQRQINAFLHEIDFGSSAHTFAVRGNVRAEDWTATFDGLPIRTVDVTESFDFGELKLTCLGVHDSFDRSLSIPDDGTGRYHIILGHGPNYALGHVEADLLLAGHTHGGQIRLPWIGPLVTLSAVPRDWAAGRTELSGGGVLYVSRGVGMERGSAPRLRFLCRPELVVIDLVPEP